MNTTASISLDLQRLTYNVIHAKQLDSVGRTVEITLFSNGLPWIPANVSEYAVQFAKPDKTKGMYTNMPNGSTAVSRVDNVLTVQLAPQIFTVAGRVKCSVAMMDSDGFMLQTFLFYIEVEESEGFEADSENYFNFPTLSAMRDRLAEVEENVGNLKGFSQALTDFSDGDILGLPVVDPDSDTGYANMQIQKLASETGLISVPSVGQLRSAVEGDLEPRKVSTQTVQIGNRGEGLIITSVDGTPFKIKVTNDGTLYAEMPS